MVFGAYDSEGKHVTASDALALRDRVGDVPRYLCYCHETPVPVFPREGFDHGASEYFAYRQSHFVHTSGAVKRGTQRRGFAREALFHLLNNNGLEARLGELEMVRDIEKMPKKEFEALNSDSYNPALYDHKRYGEVIHVRQGGADHIVQIVNSTPDSADYLDTLEFCAAKDRMKLFVAGDRKEQLGDTVFFTTVLLGNYMKKQRQDDDQHGEGGYLKTGLWLGDTLAKTQDDVLTVFDPNTMLLSRIVLGYESHACRYSDGLAKRFPALPRESLCKKVESEEVFDTFTLNGKIIPKKSMTFGVNGRQNRPMAVGSVASSFLLHPSFR